MNILSARTFAVLCQLYLATELVDAQLSTPCDGACANGGICVMGGAAGPPSIHEETVDDFHCACPPGWSGPTCSDPFDSCSDTKPCANNGECVLGLRDDYNNEQNFCDCNNAVDEKGVNYVGKWCEKEAVTYCNGHGDFCSAHGTCNLQDSPGDGPMCSCAEGYGGPHCEFEKGQVPKCDLECMNGGHCILGETSSASDIYHYWDTSENQEDQKHCRCPEGYDGPLCEHRKSPCGDGHCFNGSNCVEKIGTDGTSNFHCDCTLATDEEGASYAGRYCQYKATSNCGETQQEQGLFCVNGGKCRANAYEGCDCDEPFTGFSCEFRSTSSITATPSDPNSVAPQGSEQQETPPPSMVHESVIDDPSYTSCGTTCQNGGTCRKGAMDLGVLQEVAHDVEHLNQTSNENFEHCLCPPGFAGVHCEHKIEVCGEGEHLCLHGSKCVTDGEYHACDCSLADHPTAGSRCEHKATNICTKGELGPSKPVSFCTNEGTCKAMVSPEEQHPGCQCSGDWTGPHCELRVSSEPVKQTEQMTRPSPDEKPEESEGNNGMVIVEIVLLAMSLVLLAAVILLGLSMFIHKKRNQAATAESVSFIGSGESYSDEPKVNLAPHRDYAMEPFPNRFKPSSSSDPFLSMGEVTRQPSRAPNPVLVSPSIELDADSRLEPVDIC